MLKKPLYVIEHGSPPIVNAKELMGLCNIQLTSGNGSMNPGSEHCSERKGHSSCLEGIGVIFEDLGNLAVDIPAYDSNKALLLII